MDDIRCPNCGTTKYANANMKMLVNVCGHSLCENCVDNLFIKGAGRCPTCDVTLKRSQFKIQLYDDEDVEKDLQIRRKLLKELHLKAEDFGSLREYNDYLETFESFVYNLASGIDVPGTQAAIEEFKEEHAARLKKSRGKVSKEQAELEMILEEEAAAAASRSAYGFSSFSNANTGAGGGGFVSVAAQRAAAAAARKENLLDQLMSSDLPAEAILRSHQALIDRETAESEEAEARLAQQRALELKKRKKGKTVFSSGISLGGAKSGNVFFDEDEDGEREGGEDGSDAAGGGAAGAGVRFVYHPPATNTSSGIAHCCPTPRTIIGASSSSSSSYLAHVRPPTEAETAAGFLALYPCQRALQEALLDLTFHPPPISSSS